MNTNATVIRDDINFLAFPNWVIGKKDQAENDSLTIEAENGFYEMKSTEGLPVRFDKMVLYFLLHKLFQEEQFMETRVVTTRYEIAKNVLFQEKNFSQQKYARIMLALKRWKAICIKFEGVFFENDNLTIKYFSIIDYVSLDKKTNKISIRFNDQYIRQLHETRFYKNINFLEYRNLTRPVSVRLYEILSKSFFNQRIWCTTLDEFGKQLTLEKRNYPSQVLTAIKPAVAEINEKTTLKFSCDYDKQRDFFIFAKQ